jgi:hypothetical protein
LWYSLILCFNDTTEKSRNHIGGRHLNCNISSYNPDTLQKRISYLHFEPVGLPSFQCEIRGIY